MVEWENDLKPVNMMDIGSVLNRFSTGGANLNFDELYFLSISIISTGASLLSCFTMVFSHLSFLTISEDN